MRIAEPPSTEKAKEDGFPTENFIIPSFSSSRDSFEMKINYSSMKKYSHLEAFKIHFRKREWVWFFFQSK